MTNKLQSLLIVASMLVIAPSGIADEPRTETQAQNVTGRAAELLRNVHQMRHEAASQEYAVRLAEFRAGRSHAHVILQSNRRLLCASLVIDSPDAAIEYDRRASEIEAIVQNNLEHGTGTKQEVAQSKSARLDALLKGLLIRPDTRQSN